MRACLLSLLLFVSIGVLAAEKQLETAKVISQSIEASRGGAAAMPIGTMIVAVPIMQRTNTVIVETETVRMTWIEKPRERILILAEGGTVEFYRDKNWFVVTDVDGKKHHFGLFGMSKK